MSRDLALRGQPDLLLGAGAVARTLRVAGRLGQPLQMALLAGLYYGAAKLGYQLEFAGPVAAIVWLPVGVGIAFLYLGGSGLWPGVLVGDLLANDYNALPIGTALGQTCGNVLEVLVAGAPPRAPRPRRRPPAPRAPPGRP